MFKTITAGVASAGPKPAAAIRWALASLSLSTLMPSLDISIANVGLPALTRSFGASFQEIQWVVIAYLLATTTLIVSAGRLADILGRRRLLLAGIALFTLASLFCGLAPTLDLLLAARALQGLGAAVMLALSIAFVGEIVPKSRTGSAMGLLGTMSAIGTTLGPSLGGVLIAGFGWRVIFLVNVPIGLLNLVLALMTLPADRPPSGHPAKDVERPRLDIAGTMLLSITLAAYALAMTVGEGRLGFDNLALLAAAIAGGVLFMIAEARVASPLLRLSMFRQMGLGAGLLRSVAVSAVIMSTLVVGPFYLSHALGLDAASVGLVMSAGPLVAALSGVPAGRIVDRFGAARMTLAGLGGMTLGLLAIAFVAPALGVAGYVVSIAFVTSHYALFQAANNTAIMAGVAPDRRGVMSGMLSLSRNLGLITGASLMGAVFALASGGSVAAATAPAIAGGMRATFLVAACLTAAALVIPPAIRWTRLVRTGPAEDSL
jgi:EmrB/QacA subfamily drug resistance transporter